MRANDPAELETGFYIVRCADDRCEIVAIDQLSMLLDPHPSGDRWGPYAERTEAIAKRVGLIRSGKCQPQ
ncbi:MAG: DDE transposase family protein [Oscillatoriales cyanobacterium]|nr:MAG: DDE transposase family protein [Oscillatoriales cyanobacterium]